MSFPRTRTNGWALLVGVFLCFLCALPAAAQDGSTVVLVVRHAEKDTTDARDPGLTAEGRARAASLVDFAGAAGVSAVYTSHYRRTRDTAAPLAAYLGLDVHVDTLTAANMGAYAAMLAGRIRARHAGQTVLVVSHSNLVPGIVAALGGAPGPPLPETEYDRFYTVVLSSPVRTLRTKY